MVGRRPADLHGRADNAVPGSAVRADNARARAGGRARAARCKLAATRAGQDDGMVIETFLQAVKDAAIPACDAWSADAVLDATVPNWRLRAVGPDAIRAEYARWFASPARFEELRRHPLADGPADGGPLDGGSAEVVEYTLSWTENGVPHAGHHMHLLRVRDDRIVADTVFCGGRWPAALLAEIESASG